MNLRPGSKVIVAVEGQSVIVWVTAANLGVLFAGQPYDPDTETWGATQVYTYEQIAAVVEKRKDPANTA